MGDRLYPGGHPSSVINARGRGPTLRHASRARDGQRRTPSDHLSVLDHRAIVRPMLQPYLERSAPTRRRIPAFARFVVGAVIALGTQVAPRAWAQVEDDSALSAAIEEVTKLNKSALDDYDGLNFDVARQTLEGALDLCAKQGLDNHAIKARTHFHLGVVLLAGGAAQRDQAIKQFQLALSIEPDITPTPRVSSPEVQDAFNEAKTATAAAARAATTAPESPGSPAKSAGSEQKASPSATAPADAEAPSPVATPGLSHDAINSAAQGSVIPIGVTTDASLAAKKVAIWFRPDGEAKFVSIPLKEYSPGNWSGAIPASATSGDEVDYFVSVENDEGELVAKHGTASTPLVITLRNVTVATRKNADSGESEEPERRPPSEEPSWFLGLAVGSGVGWVSGNGDINNQDKATSGFGSSQLGHALPEIGYFVSPDFVLSLQMRIQVVSGATSERDLSNSMCGPTHVCSPAKGALAAFGRLTWLFGENTFAPYLSVAAGAGQIRHLATFPKGVNCGNGAQPVKCVDTVTAGPILLGPGAGLLVRASRSFGLTLGVNTLLGFPDFTFHVDFNAGIAVIL